MTVIVNTCTRMPAVFIDHGGGPLPLLGRQPAISSFLSSYASTLPAIPRAIVLVTAHWERPVATVSTGSKYPLLFDYGGFPKESYEYKYPAPGEPEVAKRVLELLRAGAVDCAGDEKRPWDHGVFVPMMLLFPKADVPVVQLSIRSDQDAAAHLKMGQALRPLLDEGVLIVGSGASFHNFGYFFADEKKQAEGRKHSAQFDSWLQRVMCDQNLSAEQRFAELAKWEQAPSAHEAHPRSAAEHLMPAFVVAGAGGGHAATVVGAGHKNAKVESVQWQALSKFASSQFEFA
mmetsp:Transcript_23916/g.50155  ORF Transcript_23916/g.50155 Transcript_23916/m.50155 type:complete len:289 (-) Transcript_23916:305-1171(-)